VAMAKIASVLAEIGELLTVLTAKLGSAGIEEMPELVDDAKEAVSLVVRCCLASDPVGELPPEEAAMLRTELVRLGAALEDQICGIIELRWAQLTGRSASSTRH
jgi:hypothetical protein